MAILGSSLAFIEGSAVGLALPAIQTTYAADSTALQWVVNGYLLVLGAFIMIGGAAGDRFGLRRTFVAGTALFGLSSVAAGFAPNLEWLVATRLLQGAGSAALVPVSLALISRHFPEDERGKAIGTWAGASALTTAGGPVVGGWLIDSGGWPWVFWSIAPLAAAAIAIALWRVPDDRPTTASTPDIPGALLLAAALATLVYATLQADVVRLLIGLALALGIAALFVRRERRATAPMMPLGIFGDRVFTSANLMTVLLYAGLMGVLYLVPFNLIQVQGYSALEAGLALLPMSLIIGAGSAAAGALAAKVAARTLLSLGPSIVAVGFAWFAIPGADSGYLPHWLPAVVLVGIGMTISIAPLTTVVMNALPDTQAGLASGVNNTAARLAGALAVAAFTGIAVAVFTSVLDGGLAAAAVDAGVREQLLAGAGELAALPIPAGAEAGVGDIVTASYVTTFRLLMLVSTLLALTAAWIGWRTMPATTG
ncbi:MAG: MFS transporter [Pseudomonadota bacterium]